MAFTRVWITGATDGIGHAIALNMTKKIFGLHSSHSTGSDRNTSKGASHASNGSDRNTSNGASHASAGGSNNSGVGFAGNLVLSGKNVEKLEKIAEECKAQLDPVLHDKIITKAFDCNDIKTVKAVANELANSIDMVFFCAGLSQRARAFVLDSQSDLKILNVNFLSVVESMKILVSAWSQHTEIEKKLIIVSSIAAHIPVPLRAMYGASKMALEHYADTVYNDLLQERIRHIEIAKVVPGFVQTNISYKALIGNNTVWGKMDKDQNTGLDVHIAATKIIDFSCNKHGRNLYIGMTFKLKLLRLFHAISAKLSSAILAKVKTT